MKATMTPAEMAEWQQCVMARELFGVLYSCPHRRGCRVCRRARYLASKPLSGDPR